MQASTSNVALNVRHGGICDHTVILTETILDHSLKINYKFLLFLVFLLERFQVFYFGESFRSIFAMKLLKNLMNEFILGVSCCHRIG